MTVFYPLREGSPGIQLIMSPAQLHAQALIEDSRSTHVNWLHWQQATPDWREQTLDPVEAGDEAHHQRCIAEYDFVLQVLKGLTPAEPWPTLPS